jgi:hypothetical protein
MEALRRGMDQGGGPPQSSRQMSTVAVVSTNKPPPTLRLQTRSRSPRTLSPQPDMSLTGLPFYTYMESLTSSSLPGLPTTCVKYLRNDTEAANHAVERMIDQLESPPGSRWRGVVGFDMEWTVNLWKGTQQKTGLIQVGQLNV